MDPTERQAHTAGYNAAILRMDREIGRLVSELEERRALDNTVLIVTSDHGEQLGEHGLYNHNNSLYYPVLYVPLMVLDFRRDAQSEVVRHVVNIRDIAATILDFAGVSQRAFGVEGSSLARFWEEPNSADPDSGPVTEVPI